MQSFTDLQAGTTGHRQEQGFADRFAEMDSAGLVHYSPSRSPLGRRGKALRLTSRSRSGASGALARRSEVRVLLPAVWPAGHAL